MVLIITPAPQPHQGQQARTHEPDTGWKGDGVQVVHGEVHRSVDAIVTGIGGIQGELQAYDIAQAGQIHPGPLVHNVVQAVVGKTVVGQIEFNRAGVARIFGNASDDQFEIIGIMDSAAYVVLVK